LSKLRGKEAERATQEMLLAQEPYETVCIKDRGNRNLKYTCTTIRKTYAQITVTEGNQANVSNLLFEKVDKLGTIVQQQMRQTTLTMNILVKLIIFLFMEKNSWKNELQQRSTALHNFSHRHDIGSCLS
jgi:hypothetical protein